MSAASNKHHRSFALLAVVLTLAVLFVPISSDSDTDAAPGDIFTYTISIDGKVEGTTPIGPSSSGGDWVIGTPSGTGSYTSINNTNSGSWTWDDDGYGPFNSFYAAFDPTQNNRMIGHLDPDDLTKLVDGTSISGQDYNIMWCLPTVYWKTSGTSLVLTNDPDAGGTAYAHTINGKVYEYIGIGVYEASTKSVGGQTILTSISGDTPLVSQTRATFRDYANNQLVNTDGEGQNGYAMVWNFYMYELYKYCTLAVINSWDSQGVAGLGDCYNNGTPFYTIPGQHDQSGPYAGTKGTSLNSTYGTDSVKVFIENAWGSVFDFVDGIVFSNRQYYIDQSAVPTDAKSGTYITHISTSLPSSGHGSSPSTTAQIWGMPTAKGGSTSSGLYDYVWSSTGDRVLFVGGSSINGLSCGLSSVNASDSVSYSYMDIGGRLAFVFDADPASGHTVTYDHSALTSAGGNASGLAASVLVPIDESFQLPNLGTVGDFTHAGWYIDGVFYEPSATYVPTGNITIQSAWLLPSVTITMYVEGNIYATLAVPKGSSGVIFTPVDVSGIFTGWFYDPSFQNEYDPVAPINSNLNLYAKGVPPLTFTTDPVADGDIVALEGQPGTVSFRATDSLYYSSVLWDFGDGTTSTDLYATHYYSEPGTYTASLTVYNNHGSDVTTYRIEVPSADPGDDETEWALVAAVVLIAFVSGALIARRIL